jgi:hypothetical protein
MIRPYPLRLCVGCLAAALGFTVGCASQSDAAHKQVEELEGRVRRLQALSDRLEERVVAVEASLKVGTRTNRSPMASTDISRPELPVVQMAPTAPPPSAPDAAPEDEEPRPLIVGEGSRVEARSGGTVTSVANDPSRPSAAKSKGNKREPKSSSADRSAP